MVTEVTGMADMAALVDMETGADMDVDEGNAA